MSVSLLDFQIAGVSDKFDNTDNTFSTASSDGVFKPATIQR